MELDFIRWLREQLPSYPQVPVGIGDDAAILRLSEDHRCVVTSDTLMDGVDFRLNESDPKRIGRKALAVNLSDLAAMAARPVAASIALVLPERNGRSLAESLFEGMIPLAKQFEVAIAGGDTNSWNGPLVISVTAIGEVSEDRAWGRSNAQVGDEIMVTGEFGGSILNKHFDFEPRVKEALTLSENYEIHAAIDVSDGLSLDVWRLTQESSCGAVLDLDAIPISADARERAKSTAATALDHALSDGEDFELVLTVSRETADQLVGEQPLAVPLTRIGRVVEGHGLWYSQDDGSLARLEPRGFEHSLN